MATQKLVTLEPSGGTYTSQSAAEAGEQTANSNLVTADIFLIVEIRGTWSSADTTTMTWNGITTDATRYIEVRADAANTHSGIWDTGKYRMAAGGTVIRCDTANVRFKGFQMETTTNTTTVLFRPQGLGITVDSCLLRGAVVSTSAQLVSTTSGGNNCIFRNCLFWVRSTGAGARALADASSTTGASWQFLNCTFIAGAATQNLYEVQAGNSNTSTFKNCLASGFGAWKTGGALNAASNYNAATMATATGGANDRVSQTFTFVNAAGGDFHLASGDAGAKDFGTDLSASGVTLDVDGATRTGTWDIGFDEITSAPAPQDFNPDTITNTSVVGDVTFARNFQPDTISNTSTVGDVTFARSFQPDTIANISTVGTPVITQRFEPGSIVNTNTVNDVTFELEGEEAEPQDFFPDTIENASTVGGVTFARSFNPETIVNVSQVGDATFAPNQNFSPDTIANVSQVGDVIFGIPQTFEPGTIVNQSEVGDVVFRYPVSDGGFGGLWRFVMERLRRADPVRAIAPTFTATAISARVTAPKPTVASTAVARAHGRLGTVKARGNISPKASTPARGRTGTARARHGAGARATTPRATAGSARVRVRTSQNPSDEELLAIILNLNESRVESTKIGIGLDTIDIG